MEIDHDLQDKIAETPEAMVPVVLCAKAAARIGEQELARCGFKLRERQTIADEAFIHGDIKLKDIAGLSAIAGIDAVSSEQEAEIF